MTEPAASNLRVLQPSAWARAVIPLAFAVIVIGLVLSGPVGMLLPEATRPWLPFLVVALVVALAIGGGLSIAYPRILVDAGGALLVRGRRVAPASIVSASRGLTSGGASYLTYRLVTSDGYRIRILVAGSPVRGLRVDQLGVLRDTLAASSIPETTDSKAALVAANALASGRPVEVDRSTLLDELDALRPGFVDARAMAQEPASAAPASSGESPAMDFTDLAAQFDADDVAAVASLAQLPQWRRVARRVLGWTFAAAILGCVVLLVVMVGMEARGRSFGAADEEPLVATMLAFMIAALVTGVLWGAFADLHDAQVRRAGLAWLEAATPEQAHRGLPQVFQRAWMATPGGRTAGFWMMVLAMVALVSLIAGPVLLIDGDAPALTGWLVLAAGLALGFAAVWAWRARARAAEARMVWLVEVSGRRVAAVADARRPLKATRSPDVTDDASDSR